MESTSTLTLSLLLLIALANPLLSDGAKNEEKEPVFNVWSARLETNRTFFILPVLQGSGGGLRVGKGRDNNSLNIIQATDEEENGDGCYYDLANNKQGLIGVQDRINIRFEPLYLDTDDPLIIAIGKSFFWQILPVDKVTNQSFMGIGRSPPPLGSFQIVSNGFFYSLRFCSSRCKTCPVSCRYVGLYNDNGVRRLALTDLPWKIMFR